MVANFMMWIITAHDLSNKILSRDSNYTVDAVMWPKFVNSSISVRKAIVTSIWMVIFVEVQLFGTGTNYCLEFLHRCGKRIETKKSESLKANSHVCRSYSGKTGGVAFCFPSSTGLSLSPARLLIFHKSFHIYLSSHWAIFSFPG